MTISEQLTLFAEDSPVSHIAKPGSAEARRTTVTSGRKCAALLTQSGPLGLLLKMCLESEQLSSTTCFLTWKEWTTPQGRLLFRLAPSRPRTSENGSLFWPTMAAADGNRGADYSRQYRKGSGGDDLPTAVSRVENGWGRAKVAEKIGATGTEDTGKIAAALTRGTNRTTLTSGGSRLNPEWCEWLMGFPMGWTDAER